MKVQIVEDRIRWNKFVAQKGGSFLQSWEWGSFQHDYGRKIYRLGVEENGDLVAGTTLIRYDLPAKRSYFFSPRGPVTYQKEILEKIRALAPKEKIIFWRLEPNEDFPIKDVGLLKVKDTHPKKTIILNLEDSEEDLLSRMKPKTRYNIRLAEKKGVQVRNSREIEDLDKFYEMISATAARQSIKIFPRSYYQLMLHLLGDLGLAELYLAEYQGKVIAADLMVAFGGTMTYLHGGASYEERRLMAPHLLQWQAICDAKRAGLERYDFFGISDEIPSWAGITRFKRGFGGEEVEYPGTYELPLNNVWYTAYKTIKKFKP